MSRFKFLVLFFFITSCDRGDEPAPSTLYFPPTTGTGWETSTPTSLGWDESKIGDLKSFLQSTNTRAFIVLKDGKIIIEEYWGLQLDAVTSFTASSNWYWASAGKTLTSVLVGIAEGENKIELDAKSSDYLGTGWTSLNLAQENKITVRHQLTMTTGLEDYSDVGSSGNKDCTTSACLTYKAEPGTRWAYHNGPYTLLDGVISTATSQTLVNYFNTKIKSVIGMDGGYFKSGFNNVFYSTPRSMARFGLLLLNKGKWNRTQVIPENYFELMTRPSQNLNLSYGYLTWLNGKSSFMAPGLQTVFPVVICADGPNDMVAAMGKNGQLINIVPSKNLVVIRMGDNPDNFLVPFTFQNEMWQKLNLVIRD